MSVIYLSGFRPSLDDAERWVRLCNLSLKHHSGIEDRMGLFLHFSTRRAIARDHRNGFAFALSRSWPMPPNQPEVGLFLHFRGRPGILFPSCPYGKTLIYLD